MNHSSFFVLLLNSSLNYLGVCTVALREGFVFVQWCLGVLLSDDRFFFCKSSDKKKSVLRDIRFHYHVFSSGSEWISGSLSARFKGSKRCGDGSILREFLILRLFWIQLVKFSYFYNKPNAEAVKLDEFWSSEGWDNIKAFVKELFEWIKKSFWTFSAGIIKGCHLLFLIWATLVNRNTKFLQCQILLRIMPKLLRNTGKDFSFLNKVVIKLYTQYLPENTTNVHVEQQKNSSGG